jgi:anti-sigma-K factor RskA
MLSQKDSMIAAMTGPDVKVVALMNQGAKEPLGRMVWNRSSNDWIMVTYNLRQPKPGKTYQVWLVTDNAKISAGTFKPDARGNTMMHARYEMPRNALRAVAITEEPEGGMPAPTGPMVVAGAA